MEREIKTIGFGRATRDRLGMYLSADLEEALELGIREIYVNSLDALTETKSLRGEIEITINSKTRVIEVRDNGPGIPNKVRKDGVHSVEAAYTMAHTGSHFDGREVNSIGLNGIGASVVTHTSSLFQVISDDKKERVEISFTSDENGAKKKSQDIGKSSKSGVYVKYTPDKLVYKDYWINKERLKETLKEMMKFYPKVKMKLSFDGETVEYHYPNGLKEKSTQMYYESENLIISLSATNDHIKAFGNRLHLPQGGAFFSHFKTQLTRQINEYSEVKLNGPQIQAAFSGYVAVFVSNPLFSNQSKTAISNKEVNSEISSALKTMIEAFSKTPEWDKTIKALELEMKAEEAAEKARQKVKNALTEISKGSKKKIIVADKLKDCINSGKGTYLAIVEGASAKGALLQGRDTANVALFDIRGKLINCLKAEPEKFLANEEIIQMAQILKAGILEDFNIKKMKYENILIAVDADEDGKNIACLLLTFFAVCMPDLLKEGRVHWLRTPLYLKGDDEFVFTEEEWKAVKNKKGWTRAKGLGEIRPIQVKNSMFGEKRRWEKLTIKNWDKFYEEVDEIMGKDVSKRRERLFSKVDFERITFM